MRHQTRIGALLDPTTRLTALPQADDDELIIAAISRNSDPIYPGLDESNAAVDLALLVLNTKTPGGLERVMREALRWVSVERFVEVMTELHGRDPRSAERDSLEYMLTMPNAQVMITLCCEALLPRVWLRTENEFLERLIESSTDMELLEKVSMHANRPAAIAAHLRLMVLDPLSEGSGKENQ